MKEYTVVIPMYNEANRIQPTLADIVLFRKKHKGVIKKVILVDDGSKDATVERCMRYAGVLPLEIVSLSENRGKWAAINEGVSRVKTAYVCLMDADNSATIWNIEKCVGDVVFGSRFSKESEVIGKSLLRTIVSHGYKLYVHFWYWVGFPRGWKRHAIQDMQCPFKVFHTSVVDFPVQSERFCGDLEFALWIKPGAFVQNLPVRFEHKRGGSINVEAMLGMLIQTPLVALQSYSDKRFILRWKP